MKNIAMYRTLLLSFILDQQLPTYVPGEAALVARSWHPVERTFYLHQKTMRSIVSEAARKEQARRNIITRLGQGELIRPVGPEKDCRWELLPVHQENFSLYLEQMEHQLANPEVFVPSLEQCHVEIGPGDYPPPFLFDTLPADVKEFEEFDDDPADLLAWAGVEHRIQLWAFANSMSYYDLDLLVLLNEFIRRMDLATGIATMTTAEGTVLINGKGVQSKVVDLKHTDLWMTKNRTRRAPGRDEEGKRKMMDVLDAAGEPVVDSTLQITPKGAATLRNFLNTH